MKTFDEAVDEVIENLNISKLLGNLDSLKLDVINNKSLTRLIVDYSSITMNNLINKLSIPDPSLWITCLCQQNDVVLRLGILIGQTMEKESLSFTPYGSEGHGRTHGPNSGIRTFDEVLKEVEKLLKNEKSNEK